MMTEEEIAQLRSYLAAQSMRRRPQQMIEALQEVHHQFAAAVATLHDAPPDKQEWLAREIMEHVSLFLSGYTTAICAVLEKGQRPPDVLDRQEIIPRGDKTQTQDAFLLAQEEILNQLASSVLQADPLVHLDITWKHFELGAMHWREWLLFARVYLLDHIRQVNRRCSHVPL